MFPILGNENFFKTAIEFRFSTTLYLHMSTKANSLESDTSTSSSDAVTVSEGTAIKEYLVTKAKGLKELIPIVAVKHGVPADQAVIVALFWLGATGVSNVNMRNLKGKCKEHNMTSGPSPSKADLLAALGQMLYEEKIVKRKDETEEVTWSNICK